jgi:hypothetical protein
VLVFGALLLPDFASAEFSQQTKLVGTGAIGASYQGTSVALSSDGNTAIVGGPSDNAGIGAAWVFVRSDTNSLWVQATKLRAIGWTCPSRHFRITIAQWPDRHRRWE